MTKIYSIQNASYQIDTKKIVNDITCDIKEGITVISGPNGAGKTTFLKLLFGIISPSSGTIERYFNVHKTEMSFVFQEPVFLNRTVEDNLKHILYCKSINKKNWDKIINTSLTKYSLEHLLKLHIKNLSGGELQLLSLIRSILTRPKILFYDEPTNNLDHQNIERVTQIIKELQNQGSSLIMVSHNDIFHDDTLVNKLLIKRGAIQYE